MKSKPSYINQFTLIFLALAAGVLVVYLLTNILFGPKDLPLMPWAAVAFLFLIASLISCVPLRIKSRQPTTSRRRPSRKPPAKAEAPSSPAVNLLAIAIAATAITYFSLSILQKARSHQPQTNPKTRKNQP